MLATMRRASLHRPFLLVLCGLTCSRFTKLVTANGAVISAPGFVMATNIFPRKEPTRPSHVMSTKPSRSSPILALFRQGIPFPFRMDLSWWSRFFPWSSRHVATGKEFYQPSKITKPPSKRPSISPKTLKATMESKPELQSTPAGHDLNGIIAVHKPANWTSSDVVAKIRTTFSRNVQKNNPGLTFKQCRVKVGHGGTLDPAATGVLVIGVGKGTKSMDLYTKGSKCYEAVGVFGFETDTADAEGVQVGQVLPFQHIDQAALERAIATLVGDIMQVPPVYSAIKIDGKRAYDLARQGVEVEMAARPAKIYSFHLTRPYAETAPEFHVHIECGGGTYVRSLIRDAARALGCAAHMKTLVRSKQGRFELADCVPTEAFGDAEALKEALARCAPLADTL